MQVRHQRTPTVGAVRSHLTVDLAPQAQSAIGAMQADWAALQADAKASPYMTFNWLESWATVYRPSRLRAVRIEDPSGGLVAIGLLEELPLRRLRFAGAPVTPIRGLLCRDGYELAAWRALGEWLSDRSDWAWMDARGIGIDASGLPGAVMTVEPWLAIELPGSFDEYLSGRPPARRGEMRRRLRIAEREGLATTTARQAEVRAALDSFVRLHRERALAKHELHSAIDNRLAEMLTRVAQQTVPVLTVVSLTRAGETLAVAVNVNHAGESWGYNTGFATDAAHFSPGLIVCLAAIRDAIDGGAHRFDLGPGDSKFKLELGGERCDRQRIEIGSRSPIALGWRTASLSRRRLRQVPWVRTALGTLRSVRARSSFARTPS